MLVGVGSGILCSSERADLWVGFFGVVFENLRASASDLYGKF